MNNTHSLLIGYILWIFGFTGAHRFYYGKPVTGTLWLFTLGLLGIGWLIDVFLIPGMDAAAERRYKDGATNYTIAWILLTFFGPFGLHRFYLGKWVTGLLFLLAAIATIPVLVVMPPVILIVLLLWCYDFWTLNEQVDALNRGYV